MSAALAIDSGKPDDFQPLLAQLVGDSLDREDTQERSALALMLVSPAIGLVYSEEVMKRRAEIPDQDILWLLDRLAERNDLAVRPVAGLAAERNLVSPLRKLFLTTLRDRGDLIPDVVVALVRAAQGKLTKADMASFGRWFDNDAERVVLAAAADDYPQEIREEAFDVLAGKSLFSEPAVTMLDWVRKDYWDRRADFVPLIGILSNIESADPARVNQVLAEMDQVLRDSNLIELLLSTKQAPVVRLLIQRYSDMLGLGVLLSLLDNESKEVRISAVKALKRFNDVGALRFIVEHYEHEEDPDVQQVYRETFEMIAEREARHGAAAGH